jgi:hypothetical protein
MRFDRPGFGRSSIDMRTFPDHADSQSYTAFSQPSNASMNGCAAPSSPRDAASASSCHRRRTSSTANTFSWTGRLMLEYATYFGVNASESGGGGNGRTGRSPSDAPNGVASGPSSGRVRAATRFSIVTSYE